MFCILCFLTCHHIGTPADSPASPTVVIIPASTPIPAVTSVPPSITPIPIPSRAVYILNTTIDYDRHIVSVDETIAHPNHTGQILDKMVLAIAPNLWPNCFTLTSPDLTEGNRLPVEYTCDGASSTLALAWSGAPAETQGYAVIMHHVAPDNAIHWYWMLYNLSANVTSLAKNMTGIGSLGTNSVNDQNTYAPPCSKGPADR